MTNITLQYHLQEIFNEAVCFYLEAVSQFKDDIAIDNALVFAFNEVQAKLDWLAD